MTLTYSNMALYTRKIVPGDVAEPKENNTVIFFVFRENCQYYSFTREQFEIGGKTRASPLLRLRAGCSFAAHVTN